MLEQPAGYIAENAGIDGAVVVNNDPEGNDPNFGYDAETGNWGDMFAAGIVDPTKVTRSALQNAASVAGLLLTTELSSSTSPRKRKKPAATTITTTWVAWAEWAWAAWVAWEAWVAWVAWAATSDPSACRITSVDELAFG